MNFNTLEIFGLFFIFQLFCICLFISILIIRNIFIVNNNKYNEKLIKKMTDSLTNTNEKEDMDSKILENLINKNHKKSDNIIAKELYNSYNKEIDNETIEKEKRKKDFFNALNKVQKNMEKEE